MRGKKIGEIAFSKMYLDLVRILATCEKNGHFFFGKGPMWTKQWSRMNQSFISPVVNIVWLIVYRMSDKQIHLVSNNESLG